MGGSVNTGGQNQNQTSVTTPWAPAVGSVSGSAPRRGEDLDGALPASQDLQQDGRQAPAQAGRSPLAARPSRTLRRRPPSC